MNYAIIDGGERLSFTALSNMVPCTIYVTNLHIDVCEIVASLDQTLTDEQKIVYINLLSKHSQKASQITALAILHSKNVLNISKLVSDFISPEFAQLFNGIKIQFEEDSNCTFLDKSHHKRLVVKALLHKLYRLFRNRFLTKQQVSIRSWVEISKNMFAEDYANGNILIYPYYFNLRRHFNYIRDTFRQNKNVSFMGLPYSLIDAFKIAYFNNVTDQSIVRFEVDACRQHAKELNAITSKALKTSDEFEAGSVVTCNILKNNGIVIVNKSHGINFSCPYVGYSHFFVFNEFQTKYYNYKSKNTIYKVVNRKNASMLDVLALGEKFNPVVILIHAKFKTVGLNFEHELQTKVFNLVTEICSVLNVPVIIKTHPSTDSADLKYLENWPQAKKVRMLNEIQPGNPIFINLNSAAYYDFKSNGPFLFVDDGVVPVDVMFGSHIKKVSLECIEQILPNYFEKQFWFDAKNEVK